MRMALEDGRAAGEVRFFVGAGVLEEQDGDAAGAAVDAGFDAPRGVGDEGNFCRHPPMEGYATRVT